MPSSSVRPAPSLHHLLGTTSFGQDVLSQLLVSMGSTVVLGLLVGGSQRRSRSSSV